VLEAIDVYREVIPKRADTYSQVDVNCHYNLPNVVIRVIASAGYAPQKNRHGLSGHAGLILRASAGRY
jgi:hypothetical protein